MNFYNFFLGWEGGGKIPELTTHPHNLISEYAPVQQDWDWRHESLMFEKNSLQLTFDDFFYLKKKNKPK